MNIFQYTLLVPYFARTKYVYLSCTGTCKYTVELYIMYTLNIPASCNIIHIQSIQFIRRTFYNDFNLCYLWIIELTVSLLNLVALLSCVNMNSKPLRLLEEQNMSSKSLRLLISTEKLVSDLSSWIIRDLRILSYKIPFFIYSVAI